MSLVWGFRVAYVVEDVMGAEQFPLRGDDLWNSLSKGSRRHPPAVDHVDAVGFVAAVTVSAACYLAACQAVQGCKLISW